MNEIMRALIDKNNPPVMIIPPGHLDERTLQVMVNNMGFQFFKISGSAISSKEDLFTHLSSELHFPSYFGHNWDAVLDCLRDLDSWLPAKGYVLLHKNPDNLMGKSLSDFQIFLEVAKAASEFWISQRGRFMLIIEGNEDLERSLVE